LDLAVELDDEESRQANMADIPSQLLFVHYMESVKVRRNVCHVGLAAFFVIQLDSKIPKCDSVVCRANSHWKPNASAPSAQIKSTPVASFDFHKEPITTIEWHPSAM
jgi:hypothetical protein